MNNHKNPYLGQVDLASDSTVEKTMIIVIELAYDDGERLSQDEVYSFMSDEADWCDEDIHWFLSDQGERIHKYESTDEFFRNLRCDSPFDGESHYLPWMREMMRNDMDY